MLVEPKGNSLAKAVDEAYDGPGTDDHVAISLLGNRSRKDLTVRTLSFLSLSSYLSPSFMYLSLFLFLSLLSVSFPP